MKAEDWLTEELGCGETRRHCIWRFTRSLISFLRSYGYGVDVTDKEMSCGIATLLFHNRGHTLLTPIYVERDDDYGVEHKQHYNHIIDSVAWSGFWANWSWWEDVDSDWGFYRRLDIQEFCWSHLDLNGSRHTRVVEGDDEEVVEQED